MATIVSPSPTTAHATIDLSTLTATQQAQLASVIKDDIIASLTPADQAALAAVIADDVAGEIVSVDPQNELQQGTDGLLFIHDYPRRELLAVTGTNALAPLSLAPIAPEAIDLEVNGVVYLYEQGAFALAGTVITWMPGVPATSFDLEPSDVVYAIFH